jgi:hypothetical protein
MTFVQIKISTMRSAPTPIYGNGRLSSLSNQPKAVPAHRVHMRIDHRQTCRDSNRRLRSAATRFKNPAAASPAKTCGATTMPPCRMR